MSKECTKIYTPVMVSALTSNAEISRDDTKIPKKFHKKLLSL
jgi:hypothetical protein